jgi:hypothetical protein
MLAGFDTTVVNLTTAEWYTASVTIGQCMAFMVMLCTLAMALIMYHEVVGETMEADAIEREATLQLSMGFARAPFAVAPRDTSVHAYWRATVHGQPVPRQSYWSACMVDLSTDIRWAWAHRSDRAYSLQAIGIHGDLLTGCEVPVMAAK